MSEDRESKFIGELYDTANGWFVNAWPAILVIVVLLFWLS